MAAPIEQKAVAGPSVALVAGYLSTILIEAIPWLSDHLTADQQQTLPVIIAFLLSSVAAYLAPHTHRPDLLPPPVQAALVRWTEQTNAPTSETTSSGGVAHAGRHEGAT